MADIKISITNESTVVTDADVTTAIAALQKQVSNDFAPVWGVGADLSFLPKGSPLPPKNWQIVILDDSDHAGDLGYHDLTPDGSPLGKVFARTDLQDKTAWTVTASHELLEMLGDPDINLYALLQDGMLISFYGYEVCDACEADASAYTIDGVLVSDFVYPAWFEGFRAQGSTKFDRQGLIKKPFEILKDGYISVFDVSYNNGWYQKYPDNADRKYRSRPQVGSRRERRGTPREQWMRSRPQGAAANLPAPVEITVTMTIDVDGAPTAYGPPGWPTLDYELNAHEGAVASGAIVGYLTQSDGTTPIRQLSTDPAPGYYISTTAYSDDGNLNDHDPKKYVNASLINYVVRGRVAVQNRVQLGDFVAVQSKRFGTSVYGIVGDAGNSTGAEGSLALFQNLGYPFQDGKSGSSDDEDIVVRYFPRSNPGRNFYFAQSDLDAAAAGLGLSKNFS